VWRASANVKFSTLPHKTREGWGNWRVVRGQLTHLGDTSRNPHFSRKKRARNGSPEVVLYASLSKREDLGGR